MKNPYITPELDIFEIKAAQVLVETASGKDDDFNLEEEDDLF